MRTSLYALIFLAVQSIFIPSIYAQKTKKEVLLAIDSKYDSYSTIAKQIWDYAEVGYKEVKSSVLLKSTLKRVRCVNGNAAPVSCNGKLL